jgi:hypothetical protein
MMNPSMMPSGIANGALRKARDPVEGPGLSTRRGCDAVIASFCAKPSLSTGAIQEGIALSRIASMAQDLRRVRGFRPSDNEQMNLRQHFDTFVVLP